MLESGPVNLSATCPGPRKTEPINANGSKADRDAAKRGLAMRPLAGRQRPRLISASCEAFLIKRGLDPDVDWHARLVRQW